MTRAYPFILLITLNIVSCGGSDNSDTPTLQTSPTPVVTPTPSPSPTYSAIFTETLDADGPGEGEDAYQLVRNKFGSNPIESPDLYDGDHQSVVHIYEDFDDIVGNHFVFLLHRDEDGDRGEFADRQRNEIKIYGGSDDQLKAFEGDTFEYSWKFKINADLELSTRFSHFFQLKAVYGDDAQPLITLSGAEQSGQDRIQIRYSPYTEPRESNTEILTNNDFNLVRGEWLEVYCRATFAEEEDGGKVELSVSRLSDGMEIVSIDEQIIDMWRGPEAGETPFVRPKWGYYRSILETENLRANEEDVRFANFVISRLAIEQ